MEHRAQRVMVDKITKISWERQIQVPPTYKGNSLAGESALLFGDTVFFYLEV